MYIMHILRKMKQELKRKVDWNMFDFSTVKDQKIADKVFQEAKDFLSLCHFGLQGITRTEKDVIKIVEKLKATKMAPLAFDTEMEFVPMVRELFSDYCCDVKLHCAVSYPMGRLTLSSKMNTLEKLRSMGVDDVCVCLDWQAVFSGRYQDVEDEAYAMVNEFQSDFYRLAFVIPATLMSDTKIIETCRALDNAGTVSIKVNPGATLGVTFEEVALIKRMFPNRFDIHPSGNIRTLADVLRYREMGCNNIHTAAALEITDAFIVKRLKEYGGI